MVWYFLVFIINKENTTWPLSDTKCFFLHWKTVKFYCLLYSLVKYCSALKEKFCNSTWLCNILYVYWHYQYLPVFRKISLSLQMKEKLQQQQKNNQHIFSFPEYLEIRSPYMYVCTPLLDALEGLFNFVTEKFHSEFFF